MTSPAAPATQDKRQRPNLPEMTPNQIAAHALALAGLDWIAQTAAVAKLGAL